MNDQERIKELVEMSAKLSACANERLARAERAEAKLQQIEYATRQAIAEIFDALNAE